MVPSVVSRCALKCSHIPSSNISHMISRSVLQASRFSTHKPTWVYETKKKEAESFEKYKEKATQEKEEESFEKYKEKATQEKEEESFEKYKEKATQEPLHFLQKGSGVPPEEQALQTIDTANENDQTYLLPHPCWKREEAENVTITHRKPKGVVDWLAYGSIITMRKSYDVLSGYTIKAYLKTADERDMLRRCIFLETIAGVPGFAAAMIRHLHSLRRMQRDHGWIHTLLEEAENERMHLMTFLKMKNPGPIFRGLVISGQIVFTAGFTLAYFISPHFCHRFVGYLEEQAVITYTHILEDIDNGTLPMWAQLPAPEIARSYWKLPDDAMMRDVILVIRADEAHHRLVNHTLGSMDLRDKNPFKPGE